MRREVQDQTDADMSRRREAILRYRSIDKAVNAIQKLLDESTFTARRSLIAPTIDKEVAEWERMLYINALDALRRQRRKVQL
jgi:uncharacterized protein with von Willebrand factor type A (vWA) domain